VKCTDNQLIRENYTALVKSGYHVDSRLFEKLKCGCTFSITLEDADSFLSLIWQEIDDSRLLTPRGQPRTLRDVAHRLITRENTFEGLAQDQGLSAQHHKPAWFEKCIPIANNFSYEAFGFIAVVPATDAEQKQSPNGSFYIFDGTHKTIVLSTLLIKKQIKYKPVQAVLLIPR